MVINGQIRAKAPHCGEKCDNQFTSNTYVENILKYGH